MTKDLLDDALDDLRRPHPFATERAAFIGCKASVCRGGVLVLGHTYIPLRDEWYTDDPRYGCLFNADAMRAAMQFALTNDAGIFHVHLHDHSGRPCFSGTDLREARKFIPDFWNVRPTLPHGVLVFSADGASGLCWYPKKEKPIKIARITAVGFPMRFLERIG